MKTHINPLLGAVLSLPVTYASRQRATALARLLLIGWAALAAAPVEAAGKPGGGGGSGGTPTGTIYYVGPWPNATTGGTAVMTAMNPDGGNQTVLGLGMFGVPSGTLHGGRRWFIYTYVIPDQYYPDGVTRRSEVFALRDDFDINDNNNADTKVQLTDDITLQPRVGTADWVPGDGLISFMGRRWSSSELGATVVEGGLYTASLVFDADGNVAGLDAQPAAPAIPFPLVEPTPGDLWPDVVVYSWAPTADMVAYSVQAGTELWVADLLGARVRIYNNGVHMPQWSPLGDKIAFTGGGSGSGIYTIKPNGTGAKRVIPSTSTWFFSHAKWSPDGRYLVFEGQSRLEPNMDLFRATSSGGSIVQLTTSAAPFQEQIGEAQGGWR